MIKSASLVLEDGAQFHGRAIRATGSTVGEAVFNTSTIGYQEILTDPSYSRQIVTLTCPHIGSASTNDADEEFSQVHAQGLMIHDLPLIASNSRNTEDLSSYLKCYNITAITDIGIRELTRSLRKKGAWNGYVIAGDNLSAALALEKAHTFPGLNGMDLAKKVAVVEPYNWTQESWTLTDSLPEAKKEDELPYHVVAYDFGTKHNILCMLVDRSRRPIVVPAQASAEDVLKTNPDGTPPFNGSGNPAPCDYVITAIQKFLKTNISVFDICLDHQLLALASGAKTVKMKFGHRDSNHPVKDVEKNMAMIAAQNHGFAMDETTLSINPCVTHRSLFDGTSQGTHRTDKPASSFQGHSETNPGPHDTAPLFDHFIALIEQYRKTTK